MARIQCGRSSVQIEGTYVPVADFSLAEGDGVYFAHHELLWKDPAVVMRLSSLQRRLEADAGRAARSAC